MNTTDLNIATVTDFKINAKKLLNELDAGTPLYVTRGSKTYKVLIHKA